MQIARKVAWLLLFILEYLVILWISFPSHSYTPEIMTFVVFVLIVLGTILNWRRLMSCLVVGFPLGWILGQLFHTEWLDPMGTRMDNLWIWWNGTIIAAIIIGAIWEWIHKSKKPDAGE